MSFTVRGQIHDEVDHKSRSHPVLSPRGAPNFRHAPSSKAGSGHHHHHAATTTTTTSVTPPLVPLPPPPRRTPMDIRDKDNLLAGTLNQLLLIHNFSAEIKELYAELEAIKDNLYFVKKGWSCHFGSAPNHPNLKVEVNTLPQFEYSNDYSGNSGYPNVRKNARYALQESWRRRKSPKSQQILNF